MFGVVVDNDVIGNAGVAGAVKYSTGTVILVDPTTTVYDGSVIVLDVPDTAVESSIVLGLPVATIYGTVKFTVAVVVVLVLTGYVIGIAEVPDPLVGDTRLPLKIGGVDDKAVNVAVVAAVGSKLVPVALVIFNDKVAVVVVKVILA